MLYSYVTQGTGVAPLPKDSDLAEAIWIDLYRPLEEQVQAVAALGYDIPTLADMEEIEISNRLYTDKGTVYMTGVLPGTLPDGTNLSMPVTFILNGQRLVTVRHHNPRPFETFPTRADRSSCGTSSPERIFLGLI
ncbi:CorA-like Mg2+ transporter protein [Paracoccus lutimaris]|uniref:CorA-like Mg2+ transporter protein n=1 Tax=Paracoccus lutimaris TaxID=1490030 RepID=A0A368Z8E5_9RHOB|nr:CorA-like Mg2+ transporter protein [Paracoccus lutimaris]